MANKSKHNQSSPYSARGPKSASRPHKVSGQVRIVAGDWRGRKIPVIEANGLRPTGDRVRETVFNWLQLTIPGSRCLDLFAGSGALGLEAASRGAKSVTLVESAPQVATQLRQTLGELKAGDAVVLHSGTAEQFLEISPDQFDVVFVDPPFELQVHQRILAALVVRCLAADAFVYIELPTSQSKLVENVPKSLELVKHKRFGDVTVFLLQFKPSNHQH